MKRPEIKRWVGCVSLFPLQNTAKGYSKDSNSKIPRHFFHNKPWSIKKSLHLTIVLWYNSTQSTFFILFFNFGSFYFYFFRTSWLGSWIVFSLNLLGKLFIRISKKKHGLNFFWFNNSFTLQHFSHISKWFITFEMFILVFIL